MKVIWTFLKTVVLFIAHLLALIFKIVYNILKALKLRIAFCYFAVCGFLQLVFHFFTEGRVFWFWVGCIAVGLWVLFWWLYAYCDRNRLRAKRREREEEQSAPQQISAQTPPQYYAPQPQSVPQPLPPVPQPAASYPRSYTVAGHENYFFLEYEDRYELYRREERGAVYVRTDYKNGQSEGL